ncbi:MAG: glycerophosphodiester phosphodiesterase [Clostridiales Family XIII bacterium]|nr:glycerophosphodiester phosphodiesterase [Clostridiales Family XIII bacterium]
MSKPDEGSRYWRPILVAHRGTPQETPENSIAGFKRAAMQGAKFIEFDLVISNDGIIYVSHDDNLKRTTGCNINVSLTDSGQLDTIMLPNGEKLPRLEEVLLQLGGKLFYIIETKDIGGDEARLMDQELIRLLKKYRMQSRVILSSQSFDSLKTLHESFCQASYMYIFPSNSMTGITARRLKFLPEWVDSISVSKDKITRRATRYARARGLDVALFTVRTRKDMEKVLRYKPDIIFTDNIRISIKSIRINSLAPPMNGQFHGMGFQYPRK